ncbi:hypothetical protein GKE82_02315 [Conexibacter sp. W3-3-2]|uniref:hypothetical protein n=1 Tax=Conexibacter sp. W3-3-2 TaxID=2675227 RepID=UPI0012B7E5E9|nr:hypothetical protein [Conexibacter sp. W3-3-2]MTD43168.1 hypothetical protein [Conexibacter sp. W3-3-2]
MAAEPQVRLGALAPESLAPAVLALVRAGTAREPALARDLNATVVLRFLEGFPAVRLEFTGASVTVGDHEILGAPRSVDLTVTGRLPDVLLLVSVPQTAGLPLPSGPRGRAAVARLADGRIELDGPLRLGRRLLTLLAIPA